MRRVPSLLAAALVVGVYVFFGTAGTWEFRRVAWDQKFTRFGEGYYASLTEGFLRGNTYMAHEADPRLAALENPYEYYPRHDSKIPYLWDASYYRGRYYLYYSPLPVVLFYLPFRVVAGAYPPDGLAGVFFCTWAFLAAVAFLVRALSYARRPLHVPLWLWIVFAGLANLIPFLLSEARVYEVATMAAMAMGTSWAYALLRFVETRSRAHATWMGVWLALSIAARPNVGMLLFATAAVVLAFRRERGTFLRAAIAIAIPLAVVGAALAAYNYARFQSPAETGIRYQFEFYNMHHYHVCGVRTWQEAVRAVNETNHFLFWPPCIASTFPFVDLIPARLDHKVSFPGQGEQTGGVFAIAPLTMAASLAALAFALRRDEKDSGTRAALYVMLGAWLVLLGLGLCWFVTARYSLDFMLLMLIATAVCVERALTMLSDAGFIRAPMRILAVVLAGYSTILGFLLGFASIGGTFARQNPELFKRLSAWFE